MTEKDKRILKIMINKVGGTASKNSHNYKVTIPNLWAKDMKITKENRTMLAVYDPEKKEIFLKKA